MLQENSPECGQSGPLTFQQCLQHFPDLQLRVEKILADNKKNSLTRALTFESEVTMCESKPCSVSNKR